MRILTLILISVILYSCGDQIAPPPEFHETVKLPIVKKLPQYDYILDPYHEFLEEVPPMEVYAREDQILVKYRAIADDVGDIPYVFDIMAVDTILYKQEKIKKIRYTVQDTKPVPAFMRKQYVFEVFDGFLIIDNLYIYCTRQSANKAIELIDKGIISDRFPYVYTMSRLEPLDSVAKNFKVTLESLIKLNSHLRNGYSIGAQVKIPWFPVELR